MVLISLVSVLNLLYFYISTFRSMCAVPNMAVFWSSLLLFLLSIILVMIYICWIIIIIIISSSSSSSSVQKRISYKSEVNQLMVALMMQ